MNLFQKIASVILISPLFFSLSCREANVVTCNYAQELQDESANLSNAAQAYGLDQTSANCEAYRQAFMDYLDEAEKLDNVSIHFNRKCTAVDFEKTTASFYNYESKKEFIEDADIIIGTDGAGSAMRKSYYLGKKFLFSIAGNLRLNTLNTVHVH